MRKQLVFSFILMNFLSGCSSLDNPNHPNTYAPRNLYTVNTQCLFLRYPYQFQKGVTTYVFPPGLYHADFADRYGGIFYKAPGNIPVYSYRTVRTVGGFYIRNQSIYNYGYGAWEDDRPITIQNSKRTTKPVVIAYAMPANLAGYLQYRNC